MVTIEDVAKRAGVSKSTVSRFLNGHKIQRENELRVQEAITHLDYQENYLAKSLRSSKTRTIGFLVNNMVNNFTMLVSAELEKELAKQNYTFMICDFQNTEELYHKKLNLLVNHQVDGLVLLESGSDWSDPKFLNSLNIPVVSINAPYDHPRVDSIFSDDLAKTQLVIAKMIEMGHTRMGVIAAPQNKHTAAERLNGVELAFRTAGLNMKNLVVRFGDYTRESGYQAANKLIDIDNVDCIFTCAYTMSQGALQAINEKGLHVGKDISYGCFDYQETSTTHYPNPTTICPDTKTIGKLAANQLLASIENKTLSSGMKIAVPDKIRWTKSIVDKR